ncbi:hypothetical protein [Burkholderia ubonensis]|nr:hypothetical protein [Burkholderia ubonensis]
MQIQRSQRGVSLARGASLRPVGEVEELQQDHTCEREPDAA